MTQPSQGPLNSAEPSTSSAPEAHSGEHGQAGTRNGTSADPAGPAGRPATGQPGRYQAVAGPFTPRDLTIFGGTLLMFIASLLPIFGGRFNLWAVDNLFFLGVGIILPVIVTALFVARRLQPDTVIRIGSLSIDQFASVVASFAFALFFLTAVVTFSGSVILGLLGALAMLAATVLAPHVPYLSEDFKDRAEIPAHVVARPAAVPTRRPVVPKAVSGSEKAGPAGEPRFVKPVQAGPLKNAWVRLKAKGAGPDATPGRAPGSAPGVSGVTGTGAARTGAGAGAGVAAAAGTAAVNAGGAAPAGSAHVEEYGARDRHAVGATGGTPRPEAAAQAQAQAEVAPGEATQATPIVPRVEPQSAEPARQQPAESAQPQSPESAQAVAAGRESRPIQADDALPPTAASPIVQAAQDQNARIGATVDPSTRVDEEEAPHYEAFWFAVPQPRTAFDEHTGAPAFTIEPGGWVLALEDRGDEFLVQHSDGRVGVLRDLSHIERG